MLNVKQESCEYQLLKSFGLTLPENEPKSTDYEANALTTRPHAGKRCFVESQNAYMLLRSVLCSVYILFCGESECLLAFKVVSAMISLLQLG